MMLDSLGRLIFYCGSAVFGKKWENLKGQVKAIFKLLLTGLLLVGAHFKHHKFQRKKSQADVQNNDLTAEKLCLELPPMLSVRKHITEQILICTLKK